MLMAGRNQHVAQPRRPADRRQVVGGGRPVAMQLVAKPFCEAALFRAAHAFEEATPWRDRRPEMAWQMEAAR